MLASKFLVILELEMKFLEIKLPIDGSYEVWKPLRYWLFHFC